MKARWWGLTGFAAGMFFAWTFGWYTFHTGSEVTASDNSSGAYRLGEALGDLALVGIPVAILFYVAARLLGSDSSVVNFPETVRIWAQSHPYAATVLALWLLIEILVLINQQLGHHGDGMGSTWSGAITITAITLAIIIPITRWIDRRHTRTWASHSFVAPTAPATKEDEWTFLGSPPAITPPPTPPSTPSIRASFCPNCGSRIVPGQKYCAECGAPSGVVTTSEGA